MGKKATKKGGTAKNVWESVKGWRPVDVGDELLLGADEYGFCGLEELDASAVGATCTRRTTATAAATAACHLL